MQYLQFQFNITPVSEAASDVLAALLADAGFETFEPTDQGLTAYVQTALLQRDVLQSAVDEFPLPGTLVTYAEQEAPNQNWNATWETEVGFEPISVGRRFVIYDDRLTTAVRIRPRQAFGSGSHATTRMILEWLTHAETVGRHIIDAGCGTGILAITAALCGAERVSAYDIDDWSVRNAQENAALNNVTIDVRLGDASVLASIDPAHIILANINRNILLADMHAFATHLLPGGQLVLSGFMEPDVPLLQQAAAAERLTLQQHEHSADWHMLVFGRK